MVGHQMPLDNLYSFICTELFYNVTYTFFVLIINCFLSILGSKYNMVLAHPFRMCHAIRLVSHKNHPHSRWFFVSHTSVSRNTKNSAALNQLKQIMKKQRRFYFCPELFRVQKNLKSSHLSISDRILF